MGLESWAEAANRVRCHYRRVVTTTDPTDSGTGTPTGFADLGLDERLLATLGDIGYESPSPIQAETIPALLAGRSPTLTGGHGPPQRDTTVDLQRLPSITDTVFPPAFGPLALRPFAT